MARVQIAAATLSGDSLRQIVHTHCASVHQAAKLVAALLRVSGVTAGLEESNGSLLLGLWLTSPAGWLPRAGISSGTLRSVIEYGLALPSFYLNRELKGVKSACCRIATSVPVKNLWDTWVAGCPPRHPFVSVKALKRAQWTTMLNISSDQRNGLILLLFQPDSWRLLWRQRVCQTALWWHYWQENSLVSCVSRVNMVGSTLGSPHTESPWNQPLGNER